MRAAPTDLPWDEQSERNFIGGAWRFTREGYSFDIYDPADSTVIAAVPLSTHRDVAQATTAARAAVVRWSALSGTRRGAVVDGALAYLAERIDRVAALACRDTGLPAQAARDDILSAIRETRAQVAGGGRPEDDTAPGVIGQILSWSSPLTLCIRTLAPELRRRQRGGRPPLDPGAALAGVSGRCAEPCRRTRRRLQSGPGHRAPTPEWRSRASPT